MPMSLTGLSTVDATQLAKNHGSIVIENLNVLGVMTNGKLSKAMADSGFYEFRRQRLAQIVAIRNNLYRFQSAHMTVNVALSAIAMLMLQQI